MPRKLTLLITLIIIGATLTSVACAAGGKRMTDEEVLKAIIAEVPPLPEALGDRIPLRGSRLEGWLPDDDAEALEFLQALADRGVGISPRWNSAKPDDSITASLRMARLQDQLGLPISVHASRCIYSFFDGDESTAHRGGRDPVFRRQFQQAQDGLPVPPRAPQTRDQGPVQAIPRSVQTGGTGH